jgi:hypothetical protein
VCAALGTHCWDYSGGTFADGCGAFRLRFAVGVYRQLRASRVGFEIQNGPLPDGLLACHRCDRPICVRGDHLFAGTHVDNEADKHQKGRASDRRGSLNQNARLTADVVAQIRARRASGEVLSVLAAEFGVSQSTICDIAKRRSWRG